MCEFLAINKLDIMEPKPFRESGADIRKFMLDKETLRYPTWVWEPVYSQGTVDSE